MCDKFGECFSWLQGNKYTQDLSLCACMLLCAELILALTNQGQLLAPMAFADHTSAGHMRTHASVKTHHSDILQIFYVSHSSTIWRRISSGFEQQWRCSLRQRYDGLYFVMLPRRYSDSMCWHRWSGAEQNAMRWCARNVCVCEHLHMKPLQLPHRIMRKGKMGQNPGLVVRVNVMGVWQHITIFSLFSNYS